MRPRSICSKISFECGMIQKLSVHVKLHIWCAASTSRSNRMPLPFVFHSSSTLAKIWVAIFCHKPGASTLPCRKHLLKLKQLSTHSKVALRDSPDISRRRAAISHLKSWPHASVLPHRRPSWCPRLRGRKNLNQWHKVSLNACTWHELGDLTFYGLHEQSQNGLRHVTDDWQDWFHTFTTQVATDSIVMWVTRLSIVDWVCFRTQTLRATLRTRNQPREESYVYSEAEHLSLSVGSARNKRQYPTVLQSLKSFLWMLDCAWMEYLLSIFGT